MIRQFIKAIQSNCSLSKNPDDAQFSMLAALSALECYACMDCMDCMETKFAHNEGKIGNFPIPIQNRDKPRTGKKGRSNGRAGVGARAELALTIDD